MGAALNMKAENMLCGSWKMVSILLKVIVSTPGQLNCIAWEQVSTRILELLEVGTYLSAELEQAPDKVLQWQWETLLMTARDLNEEGRAQGLFPQTLAIHDQHKGYPDLNDDMVAFAKNEGGLQTHSQEYHNFLDAYAADQSITRFHLSGYNTHRIGVVLDGLNLPERHFTAQPNFLRQCKMFITQDEIDRYFLRQSTDTRLAVYSHSAILTIQPNTRSLSNPFLASTAVRLWMVMITRKRTRALECRRYARKNYDEVKLTIPKVVKEYEQLIAQKRFPGEDAIAQIPKYERGQLARIVYHGFCNASDDVPRPYPKSADFYEAVPVIEAQLPDRAKAAEMQAALTSRLDSMDENDSIASFRPPRKRAAFGVCGRHFQPVQPSARYATAGTS